MRKWIFISNSVGFKISSCVGKPIWQKHPILTYDCLWPITKTKPVYVVTLFYKTTHLWYRKYF